MSLPIPHYMLPDSPELVHTLQSLILRLILQCRCNYAVIMHRPTRGGKELQVLFLCRRPVGLQVITRPAGVN